MLKYLLHLFFPKGRYRELEGSKRLAPDASSTEGGVAERSNGNSATISPEFETVARWHHYFFAHKVLPAVFFNNPENFLFVLRTRGIQELQASWDRVGSKIEQGERVTATGLACEIRELGLGTTIALITLPAPERSPEAYFAAAVYRAPQRPEPAVTRFFTLECVQPRPNQNGLLCEWTSDEVHHIRTPIFGTELDAFCNGVVELVNMARA